MNPSPILGIVMLRGTRIMMGDEAAQFINVIDNLRRLLH